MTDGAAAVELKINDALVPSAPTGVGLYTYTTPSSGTHTLSLRVKDNEGTFSNPVSSTFTVGSSSDHDAAAANTSADQ